MLAALRRGAASLPAKILFGILILSFAVWGVGDMFTGQYRAQPAITIDGEPVSTEEVRDFYQRQLSQLQRMLQGRIEPTDEMRQDIMRQSVDQIITLRLADKEAQRLGLAATTDMVRNAIISDPNFQGVDGRFSVAEFNNALQRSGFSEAFFVARLRENLLRQQLGGTVRANATAPQSLARLAYAYQNERRVADMVAFRFEAAPEPAAATEEQLRRFHENNPDAFQAPEYRKISVMMLSPEIVAARVSISDEDLRLAFPERRANYDQPERREVQQIVTRDEAVAERLAAAWKGGASWEAISTEARAANAQPVALGTVSRQEMPLAALADPVFGAATGTVVGPVRSPLGLHVLRVGTITPPRPVTFDEVKDRMREEMARDRSVEVAIDTVNKVEDSLAEGLPIEEVARRHELPMRTIEAIDREGQDATGAPVDLDPIGQQLVEQAFATEPGQTDNRMVEAENNIYFFVRVEGITPPALRPFETVAEGVRAAWNTDQRRRAQETAAAALLAALKEGKPMAEAAAAAGATVTRSPSVGRAQVQGSGVPAEMLGPLFALRQGEPTMVRTEESYVVAQLVEVTRPDPAADAAGVANVRTRLGLGLADDLERQFLVALRQRASITVNQTVINNIVSPQ
ncbi:MAG: SurA N-terminal domain-containing protein [Alphaproteobacteria bacterium]|nr:SurA N-terminal domain-containing protein [Alphaproteobacteria bacterium]